LKRILHTIFLGLTLSVTSCDLNIYPYFQSGDSADAILEKALDELNAQLWSEAVATLLPLYAIAPNYPNVRIYLASAYAGGTGFTYLSAVQGYSNALQSLSTNIFFLRTLVMTSSYFGTADQTIAQNLMSAYGVLRGEGATASLRFSNTNNLLTFIALSHAHTLAKVFADVDNDEVVDGGFDPCQAASLPDAWANQMMSALATFVKSVLATDLASNSSFSLIARAEQDLRTIDTAVQALGANIPSIWNENVTACGVNATACKAIRGILAGHKFLDAGDTIRTADAPVGTAVCSGGCVQLGILNNIAGGTHCP
jgi:hypothetical protein